MADPQPQQAVASSFPTPPVFYQSFTPENLARIESLRVAQAGVDSKDSGAPTSALPIRVFDLPPELRYLQPPQLPADGIYRCFGDQYNVRTNFTA